MISAASWLGLVLDACPDFSPLWQRYQDRWADEGSPGICTEMSAFANFVKERIVDAESSEVARIFDLIEHLLVFGDEDVQTAATTCCLENILNVTPSKIPPERFVQFLGPKSREFCRAWDEFTGITTPGL